jgi:hypothetical protein
MAEVSLRFHPSAKFVIVRELAGKDEQLVESAATADAIRLISSATEGSTAAPEARSLAAPDRDRILAAIYIATFGSRIDSTVHCARCGNLFDLNFKLDELAAALDGSAASGIEALGEGRFRSAAGFEFRLPTGEEELEAARFASPDAECWLAERCVASTSSRNDLDTIQQGMEDAAPTLDLELEANCPECNATQPVRFDIQSYLLNAIRQGRPRLLRDMHRIASAYHWPRRDILALPRSQRRDLVDLIEGEVSLRRRATL